jgi:dipeptidyl aminopeptidase/acylaminoacyl peptidase
MDAARPRGMTAEDTVAITEFSQLAISPDGQRVAYVRSRPVLTNSESTRRGHIWVVSTSGGDPFRLTNGPRGDSQPQWSPDGTRVAFVSRRGDDVAQVWAIRADGGEAWQVTRSKTAAASPRWAPDGQRIAYTAPAEATEDEERRDRTRDDPIVVGSEDSTPDRLWTADIALDAPDPPTAFDTSDDTSDDTSTDSAAATSDGTPSAPTASRHTSAAFHVSDPRWAPDGSQIAFVASPTPRADDTMFASTIRVLDLDQGSVKDLTTHGRGESCPRWSPDGATVCYLHSPEGYGQKHLYVVAADGGASRCLTASLDRTVENPMWVTDGEQILCEAHVGVERHLLLTPAAGGDPRQVTSWPSVMHSTVAASETGTFATLTSASNSPVAVAVGNIATGAGDSLTHSNPQLSAMSYGETRVLHWTSSDGTPIEGLLVLPAAASGSPFPLIVDPHGGPHGGRDLGFRAECQYFAAEGFATFSPNFRGSDACGGDFARAYFGDWGGGDYKDIMLGVDMLVAQGVADPDRLVVAGWSYGGYMTAWAISQTDRFRAAMCGCGISNAFSMYGTTDIPRFREMYFDDESPAQRSELYRARSGLSYAANITTPTLILHGEEDERVPISQSEELYTTLRAAGVETEFVRYPREGHSISEPRHRLDVLRRQVAWYRRHLGLDTD